MNPFFFLNAFLTRKLMSTVSFEKLIDSMPEQAKRYRQIEQSDKLKEYRVLEMTVNGDNFQSAKKNAYSNRKTKAEWLQSDEAKQEARFNELKNDADIQFFLGADKTDIQRAEALDPIFTDDFRWSSFASSPWKAGFVYPTKDFQSNHTYTDELQAYNEGRNVHTQDGTLFIHTRKEHKQAPAWDNKKGMIMKDFNYTTDVINTGVPMSRDGGLVMLKAQCHGHVNHGAYLRSDKHLPYISIFDYRNFRMYCGLRTSATNGKEWHLLEGLQPIRDLIFTVAWNRTEIMWFINNMLVYKTANNMPHGEKLYLHLYSYLFAQQRRITEGSLEVKWVRCFNIKD